MLKDFYKLPFMIQNNITIIDLICKLYENNMNLLLNILKSNG